MRVGRTRRGSAASKAGCGDRRAHITSPERHNSIQKLRLIASHAPRQHLGFPRRGRNFVALQLLDDLQRAIHAMQAAARLQMLPAKQKALKLCRGDRLDFAAQLAQRQAMNARQNAPIAPFGFASGKSGVKRPRITWPSDSSFSSAASISSSGNASVAASDARGHRPERFHPAAHRRAARRSIRCSRSVATQNRLPRRSITLARPVTASCMKQFPPLIHSAAA